MPVRAQSADKEHTTNISVTSWVILLVFLPPVYYPWKLQIDHVIVWAYSEITNDRHLKKECSYSAEDFVCTLVFMATVNYSIFFFLLQGSAMPFFLLFMLSIYRAVENRWASRQYFYLFYLIFLVWQFFCDTAGRFMSFFYCFLNSSNKKRTFESIKQNLSEKLFCLFCVRRPSTRSKENERSKTFLYCFCFAYFFFKYLTRKILKIFLKRCLHFVSCLLCKVFRE